jgi:hypothetical protein
VWATCTVTVVHLNATKLFFKQSESGPVTERANKAKFFSSNLAKLFVRALNKFSVASFLGLAEDDAPHIL